MAVTRNSVICYTPLTLATLETGVFYLLGRNSIEMGFFFEKVTLICQAAGSGDWFSLEPVSSPVAVKLTVTAQH